MKALPVTAPVVPSNVILLVPTVTLLLAFTELTIIDLFKLVVIVLLFRATVILESPLNFTVPSLLIVALLPAVSLSAVKFQVYAFCETALLIASATFLASAMPASALAVPFVTLMSFLFALSLVARLTSPLPTFPLKARFTLFNCATLTASVSLVPAARPVI